ncbi:MAG: hypothetical protein ABSB86_09445 [Bryobacteraceae bacterium]
MALLVLALGVTIRFPLGLLSRLGFGTELDGILPLLHVLLLLSGGLLNCVLLRLLGGAA